MIFSRISIARYMLWFYVLFIIYTTLYPFTPLQDNGIGIFEFWSDPKSIYISRKDIWLNVIGYVPLGALWVWRWHPKPSGIVAIFLSTLLGSCLSFILESIQTYLPHRVPSQLDWYTNTIGAFMGSIIAVTFSPNVLSKTKIVTWYRLTFNNSSFAIVLCMLWFGSIIFPRPYWFGFGSWVSFENINFLQFINDSLKINSSMYEMIIPFVTIFHICGTMLAITFSMKNSRILFSLFILCILLIIKIISVTIFSSIFSLSIPKNVWIGISVSILIIVLVNKLKAIPRGVISVIFLLMSLVFANMLPLNTYHEQILINWQNNSYTHAIGIFKWIGLFLPWLSLSFVIYKISTYKK